MTSLEEEREYELHSLLRPVHFLPAISTLSQTMPCRRRFTLRMKMTAGGGGSCCSSFCSHNSTDAHCFIVHSQIISSAEMLVACAVCRSLGSAGHSFLPLDNRGPRQGRCHAVTLSRCLGSWRLGRDFEHNTKSRESPSRWCHRRADRSLPHVLLYALNYIYNQKYALHRTGSKGCLW